MILESNPASKTVLVCQGNTCSPSGADKVLAVFQAQAPPGVTIIGCGCLGQCGNGPMVLILPEKTWYSRVHINSAEIIIEQHLRLGKPVPNLLYSQFHPLPSSQEQKKSLIFGFGYLL
ncbi:ferredoxin [Xenococcus sp. PCC 7305]|uniref:(2Fe-2S) ferredoxin domain-containing protein n=1 Tax=Xenococcus sp. PCC 7305 TaxID=102125 RepID=UPI0002AC1180|nr:(2Fe-2S) ferredoxin domain-containing protein [Xenococcus sp. PCC 7305]ELS02884.1 ferredoxin [Xenococcus sp. PCC 7305]